MTETAKHNQRPTFIGGLCTACGGAKFKTWRRDVTGQSVGVTPCPTCNGAGTEEAFLAMRPSGPLRPIKLEPEQLEPASPSPLVDNTPTQSPMFPDGPASEDEDGPMQGQLFELQRDWEKAWGGMPEFISRTKYVYKELIVRFKSKAEMLEFAALVGQTITPNTESIWYPKRVGNEWLNQEYYDAESQESAHES